MTENTHVLPVPDLACATRSTPTLPKGIAFNWIGDGIVNPLSVNPFTNVGAKNNVSNVTPSSSIATSLVRCRPDPMSWALWIRGIQKRELGDVRGCRIWRSEQLNEIADVNYLLTSIKKELRIFSRTSYFPNFEVTLVHRRSTRADQGIGIQHTFTSGESTRVPLFLPCQASSPNTLYYHPQTPPTHNHHTKNPFSKFQFKMESSLFNDLPTTDLAHVWAAHDDVPTVPSTSPIPLDMPGMGADDDQVLDLNVILGSSAYADKLTKPFFAWDSLTGLPSPGDLISPGFLGRELGDSLMVPSPTEATSPPSQGGSPSFGKVERVVEYGAASAAGLDPMPRAATAADLGLLRLFPRTILRASREDYKAAYKANAGKLSSQQKERLRVLRRKELSCVYADSARHTRIKTMKKASNDVSHLSATNKTLATENQSLRQQIEQLKRQLAGDR
jgi:hypothetical protein